MKCCFIFFLNKDNKDNLISSSMEFHTDGPWPWPSSFWAAKYCTARYVNNLLVKWLVIKIQSTIHVRPPPISELYSTANDPETENDPQNGPQMIIDRKWSLKSTANDPVKTWGMEWILWDWLQKRTDYEKRNLFLSPFKEKGKEDATSQVYLYKAKRNGINLKRYGVNRILLPLSIASIFFQECFVFWKI